MGDVTLKDLAKALDLTVPTVSRALNGYDDIAEDTKKRVLALASQRGYVPNTAAKRLALGRTEAIGYIMPWDDGYGGNSFSAGLIEGLLEVSQSRGWDLVVMKPQSDDEELALFTRLSKSRHLDGVIISRTLVNDRRIAWLQDLNIPFVAHGRSGQAVDYAWIDVDNHAAFSSMVTHLADLGHRHIGHIAGPAHYNFARQRYEGYRAGLEQARLDYSNAYVVSSSMSLQGGRQAMAQLLDNELPPSALCCVSDIVAVGCMQTLNQNNLVPGRDISLIGYDGLMLGELITPALSTLCQPVTEAGRRLAATLFELIDGKDPHDFQQLSCAELVRRETDNPPPEDWPSFWSKHRSSH